jgi:hypothetical protein
MAEHAQAKSLNTSFGAPLSISSQLWKWAQPSKEKWDTVSGEQEGDVFVSDGAECTKEWAKTISSCAKRTQIIDQLAHLSPQDVSNGREARDRQCTKG